MKEIPKIEDFIKRSHGAFGEPEEVISYSDFSYALLDWAKGAKNENKKMRDMLEIILSYHKNATTDLKLPEIAIVEIENLLLQLDN